MFPELDARRRRPARRLLIPLVIAAVGIAVWWVGSAAQDQLSVGAYVGEIRTLADAQATRAETFRKLLLDTGGMQVQRASFTATVEQLVAGNRRDLETLNALVPPADATATQLFLTLTLERRIAGLQDFSSAAMRLHDRADLAARSDFTDAVTRLQVADGLYTEFLVESEALTADADGPGVAPFSESRYVESVNATPGGIDQLINAILENPAMTASVLVEIVSVSFTPDQVGTPGGGTVQLPATDSMGVAVLVRNSGTDRETGLEVRLEVRGPGGAVIPTDARSVTELAASGASTTLDWSGIPVEAGRYGLRVVLARQGGGTIDTETLDVVVQSPSG